LHRPVTFSSSLHPYQA
jgi:hypothetical protein